MSNHVWISSARQESTLIRSVLTEIESKDKKKEIDGQQLNEKGASVPPELCPKKIWGDGSAQAFKEMPDLFWARSQWIVSERAADIMRKFDLGGGALYPVSEGVFQSDGVTPLPGNYFCWIFGNIKKAFMPDLSRHMRCPDVPGLWWSMPWILQDEDVAVSQAALAGPEVWLDKMLFKSVFLSGPLGDALDRADLRKAFRLFKCRVISSTGW
jgi:hypothetical protein